MRDGNSGKRRRSDRRRQTRNDLEWHASGLQRERFFAAATEDEWIPAFESNDSPAANRLFDER
jgi:hypothetical protein